MINFKFEIGDKVKFLNLSEIGVIKSRKIFLGSVYKVKQDDIPVYEVYWEKSKTIGEYTEDELNKW